MDDKTLADKMFGLTPSDNRSIGNVTLFENWKAKAQSPERSLEKNDYWRVRQTLLDAGRLELGKGKGGSVRRTLPPPGSEGATQETGGPSSSDSLMNQQGAQNESALYRPICRTIHESFATGQLAMPVGSFVACVTASQGAANTGGKWTRPDITLVYARRFEYLGPHVEVVTFEVKPRNQLDVDGVFEAAAHSARAHKVYLLGQVDAELSERDAEKLERIERECLRFGVGFATFVNEHDGNTWEVHVWPEAHSPDPDTVESWLKQCLRGSDGNTLGKIIASAFTQP